MEKDGKMTAEPEGVKPLLSPLGAKRYSTHSVAYSGRSLTKKLFWSM
jgi:hypothetical protein